MPLYYRRRPQDEQAGTIAVRVFALREGISCVVSWPLPDPGLRVFSPTRERPEMVGDALPYAQFLSEFTGLRVTIELDPGMEWQPAWGELREWEGD